MTYEEALEYIHSVQWRGSKRGLSRTKELLAQLGSPEKNLKFVHVAGTNGKGSTCACIDSILRKAGYKTGLYTSPFISRFNERIRFCGEDIDDQELADLTEEIRPYAEACEDKPTEFEIITALGFLYFARKQCDIVVLEVGLGGEFDSTNVIDPPEAAVITAIGLDHTEQLGPTITDVAKAKAGIIKTGTEAVIYGGVPEADAVFEETCERLGVPLTKTALDEIVVHDMDLTSCTFDYGRYKNVHLALAGTYQPNNASVAIGAIEILRKKGWEISDENIYDGLATVSWPGRFELLRRDPIVMLDGAHNPHGVTATADSLKKHFGDKKIVFLSGVMADKDIGNMFPLLAPLADRFVTVTPNNKRSLPAEDYAQLLRDAGIEAESAETIQEGARRAIELAGKDGVVCALGSLYFSQDVREAIAAVEF